ncbi:hypothetical protein PVAND_002131 [Polypedilum vanderplanki]|uniref:MD-2-related lipid-recognition domain-containing protein n=1 Tax=Polypedilum vanderplanki TaxID=319348 RepID=A0A9J6BRG7_POLVA|nr:hypothetical protein PVAND_002131 [Polypedilum vanderplanki]
MKFVIFFLILTTLVTLSLAIDVKKCSSSNSPKSVSIKGCEKSPCRVKKGSVLSAEIFFTTRDSTSTLQPKLSVKMFGIRIPLKVPSDQQNACQHLKNSKCPLIANQEVTYSVELPILSSYPSIKTEIEVNLVGDNQKSLMCFKIDGQIYN